MLQHISMMLVVKNSGTVDEIISHSLEQGCQTHNDPRTIYTYCNVVQAIGCTTTNF